jgi:hypothetical protein
MREFAFKGWCRRGGMKLRFYLLVMIVAATFAGVPAAAAQAPPPPQPAGCGGVIVNLTGSSNPKINAEYNNPLEMNHEGRTERSSDLAIYSVFVGAQQTCMVDGNVIDIAFPEILTNAAGTSYGLNGLAAASTLAGGVTLPTGAFQLFDPNSTLNVTIRAFTVSTAGPGGIGTDIQIKIITGTTAGTTALPSLANTTTPFIVLQNLRWDVVPMGDGTKVAGQPFSAVLSVAGPDDKFIINGQPVDTSLFDPVVQVGTVRNTIFCTSSFSLNLSSVDPPALTSEEGSGFPSVADAACADVYRVGFGLENGVNPYVFTFPNGEENSGTGGPGNTSGNLIRDAIWYMTENPNWVFVNPFRINLAPNRVPSDISTTPTDLVIDLEQIPFGVTITLPQTLTICQGSVPGVQWKLAPGSPSQVTGTSAGNTNLIAVYNTVLGDVVDPSPGTPLVVFTAPTASDVNCATNAPPTPTIGVNIGDPSGIGNILLRVVMGPSEGPGTFTGDEVSPNAIPRYVNTILGSPSRGIIEDAKGNPIPYIDIDPTRTYLLYTYVTDKAGWQAGIEVSNTGYDAQVFSPEGVNNKGQAGALDIWFFPTGSAAFMYTAQMSDGRGLDANGLLQPGSIWADTLDSLLLATNHPNLVGNFDGYIIIVCHFNFGHGAAYLFSSVSAATLSPALVLGGSSARVGNIKNLPERLNQ